MSLWAVLLTGLFASGASCAAVQGGLLAGILARRRPEVATEAQASKADETPLRSGLAPARLDEAAPVDAFLAGKLVSHAVLGAALGLVGEAVQGCRPVVCPRSSGGARRLGHLQRRTPRPRRPLVRRRK